MTAKRSRGAFFGVAKSRVQSFSAPVVRNMGRPLRAHVLMEMLRVLICERSVAYPEMSALFNVPLRSLFRCIRSDIRTRLGVTEARA